MFIDTHNRLKCTATQSKRPYSLRPKHSIICVKKKKKFSDVASELPCRTPQHYTWLFMNCVKYIDLQHRSNLKVYRSTCGIK